MEFEWDPAKATRKFSKHGIEFSEAATIFGDPLSCTFPDPDHSDEEECFITIRMSNASRVLIVSHTDRGRTTRIISARKATRRERTAYEEE